MKRLLVGAVSVLLLAFVAADEAQSTDLVSLVEAGATLPNDFTICLKDRPMMCLAPGSDIKTDGTPLVLADRLRTVGQTFRLEGGVLRFADGGGDRVVSAEHGAQTAMDSAAGGRVWVWKEETLNYDQQWNANEDLNSGSAQICMRAFPNACLYTSYPNENKVIIANSGRARTLWVVRPIKPCAASPCDANAQCTEQPDGAAKCTCNSGYKLGADNRCFELDLCAAPATNPCDDRAVCAKSGPGKAVCVCNTGYQGKGGKGECAPIDACAAKPSPCDMNSDCSSTGPNTFKCSCKAGFVPTGATTCGELDLCATANPCAATATCVKTGPGKASCQCNPGFAGNGQQCTPVDGCEGTPCGQHASCVRAPLGGRQCNCDAGYEVDKKSKEFRCAEANPCSLKGAAAVCKGRNTECHKTAPGEHKCLCKSGFLAFWNGNCEKPGSKEALEAAAAEGSESARQELIIQQRKAKEAEGHRKEIEMEFRRKQKEREENIRALERRIREMIHEKTNERVQFRDTRIGALNEEISRLQTQQLEAQKTAKLQLQLIKAMEAQEATKLARLTAAITAAKDAVTKQATAYALKVREATRDRLAAELAAPLPEEPKPAPAPKPKRFVATKPKPADPPRYGDNFSSQPLKLPIGKPTTVVAQSAKAAANAYIASVTPPAPAPKPKPAQPVFNPADLSSAGPSAAQPVDASRATQVQGLVSSAPRFQQVDIASESEVHAASEALAESEAAATAELESLSEAGLQSSVDAEVAALSEQEVTQSDEDLAEQLSLLHNEVDGHLDALLAGHHDLGSDEEDAADAEEAEAEHDF